MEPMSESLQSSKTFDPAKLQASLIIHYRRALKDFELSLAKHHLHKEVVQEFILFLNNPGKMMRSLFLLGSYLMGKENTDEVPAGVYQIAIAQEIFHNFTLIHDDVVDGSTSRRGEPTLHCRFGVLMGESFKDGEHIAIVLGDMLFGYCMDVIMNCQNLPPDLVLRVASYFSQTVQSTGCGQVMEMYNHYQDWSSLSLADLEQVYYLKTSKYTIESPVILGQLLRGRELESLTWVQDFAKPLGQAFQMENDLHEIRILPTAKWKLAYDIFSAVKTIYNHHLIAKASSERRLLLINLFSKVEEIKLLSQEQVLDIFYDPLLLKDCEDEIGNLISQSLRVIENSPLSAHESVFFQKLVSVFTKKIEHSES